MLDTEKMTDRMIGNGKEGALPNKAGESRGREPGKGEKEALPNKAGESRGRDSGKGEKEALPNEARKSGGSIPGNGGRVALSNKVRESRDREPGKGERKGIPNDVRNGNRVDRQTFLREKPYEFLPLLEKREKIQRYSHQDMAEETYSGKLRLSITILSPLHIGSSLNDYDAHGNAIKKQMRRNKTIVIPGSSIKGPVRSIAEAVSFSCAVKPPYHQLGSLLPSANNLSCSSPKSEGICITCSMFGMAGEKGEKDKRHRKDKKEGNSTNEHDKESYKGKVAFGEFASIKDSTGSQTKPLTLPQLESPFKDYPKEHDVFGKSHKEKHYGNERLYYCKACDAGDCQNCSKQDYFQKRNAAGKNRKMAFRGRKFYSIKKEITAPSIPEGNGRRKENHFEMINPGSVFEGEILFQNLTEEEGKLLAYSLGIGHHFTMKIGYGKPLGYGKINVDLLEVEDMRSRYNLPGTALSKGKVESWAEEYHNSSPDDIKAAIEGLERMMAAQ